MVTTWTDLQFFESGLGPVLEQINDQQARGLPILPAPEDFMNALALTPFDGVRVVILGQDPYPNAAHAHGLAFSVPRNVQPLPASLQNVYEEMKDDLGCCPETGDLTGWAQQGVLLLNASLSVVAGSPGSHAAIGWSDLATEIITTLSTERTNLVFILWGRRAQAKSTYVDSAKHLIIRGTHPSPQAANRGGFFGTRPFSRTNAYLRQKGLREIDWCAT